jgi:hypothetical protein
LKPLATLPLAVFLPMACSEPPGLELSVIRDFVAKSVEVECSVVPFPEGRGAEVTYLTSVGDSAVLALSGESREVFLLDPELRTKWSVLFDRQGPRGLLNPQAAALVADSLLYVVDRPSLALDVFDLRGSPKEDLDVGIQPDRIASTPGGLVVTSLLAPVRRGSLARFVSWDGQTRDLPVDPLRFSDWRLETLANLMEVVSYPGGRIVLAHRFFEPRAFLTDDVRRGSFTPVAIPLPDGLARSVGFQPVPPFEEEELKRILPPVIDAAADTETGDFLYLTRSGRRLGEHFEKAIIRVTPDFRYRASYLLPVNGGLFAYRSRERESIVVDDWGRWHTCATP